MSTTITKNHDCCAERAEASGQTYLTTRVQIVESKDHYVLEAEMPGVNLNGLDVSLVGNELTITGRRQSQPESGETLHRESSLLDYRRGFTLGPVIDTARITAKIRQGFLTLDLPKVEAIQPRKIAVGI